MRIEKLVLSAVCTAVMCTAVSAQEAKPNPASVPQQSSEKQGTNKSFQGTVTPEQFATCWALDNQEEIILAKFAQEKSKNKEVIQFAKMIAEEHQACLKKLSKFAPEASREGYLVTNHANQSGAQNDSTPEATQRPDQDPKSAGKVATSPIPSVSDSGSHAIDMMQFQREVAQQCIADSKKYLDSKGSDDFDETFVGMQIGKHAAMHTKLVVLQRHTSDQMREMVTEGIQSLEKHMKAAESLMEKLDRQDSSK